jgi:hypothetical protein|tara:strand:+ start:914 stop:1066 length:153 start_codon:yes stop_codon:yes gene_type:complete
MRSRKDWKRGDNADPYEKDESSRSMGKKYNRKKDGFKKIKYRGADESEGV